MYRRVGTKPITDAEALTVACPDCKASPDSPCVYLWPKGVTPEGSHNAKQQARIDLVGTPCRKAHNGRRGAYVPPVVKKPATEVRVQMDADSLRIIYAALYDVALEGEEHPWADGGRMTWIAENKIAPAVWKLTGEWP